MAESGYETLSSLRTQVFELLGEASSQGRLPKIDSAINRAYTRIAASGHWPTLELVDEVGLTRPSDSARPTLLGGVAEFPMPWGSRDATLILQEPAGREVEQMGAAAFYRAYAVTDSGTPKNYCIVGETVQHTKLAAADTVVITGDAANDAAAAMRIWYRTSDNETGEVTDELFDAGSTFSTGVTTTGTLAAGYPISRIVVNDKWVGAITIARTTGATELAKLSGPFLPIAGSPFRRVLTRPLARLGPLPSVDTRATVVWRRQPRRLVNPTDAPEIPVGAALVYAAAAELLRVDRQFSMARDYEAKSQQALDGSEAGESRDPEIAMPLGGNLVDGTGTDDL